MERGGGRHWERGDDFIQFEKRGTHAHARTQEETSAGVNS